MFMLRCPFTGWRASCNLPGGFEALIPHIKVLYILKNSHRAELTSMFQLYDLGLGVRYQYILAPLQHSKLQSAGVQSKLQMKASTESSFLNLHLDCIRQCLSPLPNTNSSYQCLTIQFTRQTYPSRLEEYIIWERIPEAISKGARGRTERRCQGQTLIMSVPERAPANKQSMTSPPRQQNTSLKQKHLKKCQKSRHLLMRKSTEVPVGRKIRISPSFRH